MIKSSLTQITRQAVKEGQVCTHGDVIISQDASYVYLSSKGQGKKTLNSSRKIYLVHSLSEIELFPASIKKKCLFLWNDLSRNMSIKVYCKTYKEIFKNIKKKVLIDSSHVFWVDQNKTLLIFKSRYLFSGIIMIVVVIWQSFRTFRWIAAAAWFKVWRLNGLLLGLTKEGKGKEVGWEGGEPSYSELLYC